MTLFLLILIFAALVVTLLIGANMSAILDSINANLARIQTATTTINTNVAALKANQADPNAISPADATTLQNATDAAATALEAAATASAPATT